MTNLTAVKTWNLSDKVLPSQWCRGLPYSQLIWIAGPAVPSPCSLQPAPHYCPLSSGPSIHLVTINKLLHATGPLKCTHIKHYLQLLVLLVLAKEEAAYFCSTQHTHTINIASWSQLQYTKCTQLNVLQHKRQKRIQPQSMDLDSLTSHLFPIIWVILQCTPPLPISPQAHLHMVGML